MLTGFWKRWGISSLIVLAVLSLAGAGVYGRVSYHSDVESYLPGALPEATNFKLVYSDLATKSYLYDGSDANGNMVGYVSSAEGQGDWGPIAVMVGWSPDGTILTVTVTEQRENPQYYNKLSEQKFFSQYIGRHYSDPLKLGEDIDAATGATISSEGVAQGVEAGRELLAKQLGQEVSSPSPAPVPEAPVNFGMPEIMLLVGLGSVVTLRLVPALKRFRWPRYLTLVFSLVVLGIWLKIPLSLINFVIWPAGYIPSWRTDLLLYILVFSVLGLAIVFAKNFYCFWLCPFCALQEGMHFIGGTRSRTITKRQLMLRNTRYVLLWLVLLLVLLLRQPSISAFEPWNTIFAFSGTLLQWSLVGVTLLVAVFIYNFWCHYLCPVGAVMDIVLKVRLWIIDVFRRLFSR